MTYTATMQTAMAFCRGELPSSQFSLLCYIVQRTERFGGKPETISYNEFMNGFTVGGADTYVAPVTSNKGVLIRAIDGLEERRWIHVQNTGASNRYSVLSENIFADECKFKKRIASMLKPRRKDKKAKELDRCTSAPQGGALPHHDGCTSAPIEVIDFKVTDLEVSESESIDSGLSFGRLKNKQALKKKLTKPTKSVKVLRAAWRLACDKHHGYFGSTVIDGVVWGKCRQAAKEHTVEDFLTLVEWSVENWASMRLQLDWATDLTELPDLGKWCVLYKYYHRAWLLEGTEAEIAKVVRDKSVDLQRITKAENEAAQARQRADAAVQKAEHLQRRITEKAAHKRKRRRTRRVNPDTPIPDELPEWKDAEE